MTEKEWLESKDPTAMLRWYCSNDAPLAPVLSCRKLRLFGFALWLTYATKHPARDLLGSVDRDYDWIDNPTKPAARWNLYLLNPADWARQAIVDYTTLGIRSTQIVMPGQIKENRTKMSGEEAAATFRDIIGNLWRPVKPLRTSGGSCGGQGLEDLDWQEPWLTLLVLSLAEAVYKERTQTGKLDKERLAILSDAMEEAGCPNEITTMCQLCRGAGVLEDEVGADYPCIGCSKSYGRAGSGKQRYPHPFLTHLRSPDPHVRGCWVIDLLLGKQ